MSIALTTHNISVGTQQPLWVAQGEDREFRLTFEDDGSVVDMTGAVNCYLRICNPTNKLIILERNYAGFYGDPDEGTPRFVLVPADTESEAPTTYEADVTWQDADGNKTQLLVLSPFVIRKALG